MNQIFNLSKTEFTAYLECPLKFYLMKQQNQFTKEGPRGLRSYLHYPFAASKGIYWHYELNKFLQEHKQDFLNCAPPPPITISEPIFKLFWEHEEHRLAVDPSNWYPLAFELYCSSQTTRGIIDRVEAIDDQSCRIVEYKSDASKSGFLTEELLFYSFMATVSKDFSAKIKRKVTQAGCYFYSTGDWTTQEISRDDLLSFRDYFAEVRKEMLTGNWAPRHDCSLLHQDCSYAVVCTKIPEKLLKDL